MPPPSIVYDSTTINNTATLASKDLDNNSNVDGKALASDDGGENNRKTVVMALHRASPIKNNRLIEVSYIYETWGLEEEGGVVIGFCTINPKDLPPGLITPEEYQKGIDASK